MMRLTEQQVADFKELGNIGAGYAASMLADLIGDRCLIGIPDVFALNAATLQTLAGEQDDFAVAVDVRARGDFESAMFIIMKASSAERVMKDMAKVESKKAGNLLDVRRELALKHLGERMVQSYMDGVNGFLGTSTAVSPAELIVDLYDKALDRTLRRLQQLDGEQILIHTAFAGPDNAFDGAFAYILNRAAQASIIAKLGQLTTTY